MKGMFRRTLAAALSTASILACPNVSNATSTADGVIRDNRIGYLETTANWALHETKERTECPQGVTTEGPREIFKTLYPAGGSVAETQLAREALKLFPQDKPAQFPYREAQGDIAAGLNLDGKVGPRDFTSPGGEHGVDNALYRVFGCNTQFRVGGPLYWTGQMSIPMPIFGYNRVMIELSGVDSLENDDKVEVTIFRGRDQVVLDSGNKVLAGGSQRIDMRYGQKLIQRLPGKIENGILVTDSLKNGIWPWAIMLQVPRSLLIRDMRLHLKLSPTQAVGFIGGYVDLDSLYRWLISMSTHHLAYGQLEASQVYWSMRRNADAYPDESGKMTAISAAIAVNMAQVFVIHPDAPQTSR